MEYKKIIVRRGEESRIRQDAEDLDCEIFEAIYERAKVQLAEISFDTYSFFSGAGYRWKYKDFAGDPLPDFQNNIIAFCGARGTGKSSALVSFAAKLTKNNGSYWNQTENMDNRYKALYGKTKEAKFAVLPLVDPNQLEDSEELMMVILTKMMNQTHKQYEDARDKDDLQRTKEYKSRMQALVNHVTACAELLNELRMSKDRGKADETEDIRMKMSRRAKTADLRTYFFLAARSYLNIVNEGNDSISNGSLLVVLIDDLDLNIRRAYEITEHIRRYLMVPGVAVLMSVKIAQLRWITESHFLGNVDQKYIDIVSYQSQESDITKKNLDCGPFEHSLDADEFYEMSHKYLAKLFPDRRRLHMPDILIDYETRLCYMDGDLTRYKDYCLKCACTENSRECMASYDPICLSKDNETIADVILALIYQKIGIHLPPTIEDEVNYIIPRTMRELAEMLAFLDGLKSVEMEKLEKHDSLERKKLLGNLRIFEEDFVNDWAQRNLAHGLAGILTEVWKSPDNNKHKVLANRLAKLENSYLESSNLSNTDATPCLADALRAISYIGDYDTRKFTYALKMLYTTTMLRLYVADLGNQLADKNKLDADNAAENKFHVKFKSLNDFIGGDLLGFMFLEFEKDQMRINEFSQILKDLTTNKDYIIQDYCYPIQIETDSNKTLSAIFRANRKPKPDRKNNAFFYRPTIYWTQAATSKDIPNGDQRLLINVFFLWDVFTEFCIRREVSHIDITKKDTDTIFNDTKKIAVDLEESMRSVSVNVAPWKHCLKEAPNAHKKDAGKVCRIFTEGSARCNEFFEFFQKELLPVNPPRDGDE